MRLADEVRQDFTQALRSQDQTRISTLRLLLAAIHNKEIEERKKDVGLEDEGVIRVIRQETRKRQDAIAEYRKAGREDRASLEADELRILEEYLPPEMPDEEILKIIFEGIRALGAPGPKDLGALMKFIMPKFEGRTSGERISKLAREELEHL